MEARCRALGERTRASEDDCEAVTKKIRDDLVINWRKLKHGAGIIYKKCWIVCLRVMIQKKGIVCLIRFVSMCIRLIGDRGKRLSLRVMSVAL